MKRHLVQIVTCSLAIANLPGDRLDHADEMKVEVLPQRHELDPRRVSVALRAHPRALIIRNRDEVIAELRAHEALMIVRGRVDEVADDLLPRPFAGGARNRRSSIGDGLELWRRVSDVGPKLGFRGGHDSLLSTRLHIHQVYALSMRRAIRINGSSTPPGSGSAMRSTRSEERRVGKE